MINDVTEDISIAITQQSTRSHCTLNCLRTVSSPEGVKVPVFIFSWITWEIVKYFVEQQSGIELRTEPDHSVTIFCFSLSSCWEKLCTQYLEIELCLVRQKKMKSMFLWPFGKEHPPSYAWEVHSSGETLTFSLVRLTFPNKIGCKSLFWRHTVQKFACWEGCLRFFFY